MRKTLEPRSTIRALLPVLNQRFRVKKIGIFGSYARNATRRGSDIDVLVEFAEPIGLFDFIELEEFLSKKLKKKVDLVTKQALKQRLKKPILRETVYV